MLGGSSSRDYLFAPSPGVFLLDPASPSRVLSARSKNSPSDHGMPTAYSYFFGRTRSFPLVSVRPLSVSWYFGAGPGWLGPLCCSSAGVVLG